MATFTVPPPLTRNPDGSFIFPSRNLPQAPDIFPSRNLPQVPDIFPSRNPSLDIETQDINVPLPVIPPPVITVLIVLGVFFVIFGIVVTTDFLFNDSRIWSFLSMLLSPCNEYDTKGFNFKKYSEPRFSRNWSLDFTLIYNPSGVQIPENPSNFFTLKTTETLKLIFEAKQVMGDTIILEVVPLEESTGRILAPLMSFPIETTGEYRFTYDSEKQLLQAFLSTGHSFGNEPTLKASASNVLIDSRIVKNNFVINNVPVRGTRVTGVKVCRT